MAAWEPAPTTPPETSPAHETELSKLTGLPKPTTSKFDNSWFREVVTRHEKEEEDSLKESVKLGAEMMADPLCSAIVRQFAEDKSAFMEWYCDAHLSLSECGCKHLVEMRLDATTHLKTALIHHLTPRDTGHADAGVRALGVWSKTDSVFLAAIAVATAGAAFFTWRRRQQLWQIVLMDKRLYDA